MKELNVQFRYATIKNDTNSFLVESNVGLIFQLNPDHETYDVPIFAEILCDVCSSSFYPYQITTGLSKKDREDEYPCYSCRVYLTEFHWSSLFIFHQYYYLQVPDGFMELIENVLKRKHDPYASSLLAIQATTQIKNFCRDATIISNKAKAGEIKVSSLHEEYTRLTKQYNDLCA